MGYRLYLCLPWGTNQGSNRRRCYGEKFCLQHCQSHFLSFSVIPTCPFEHLTSFNKLVQRQFSFYFRNSMCLVQVIQHSFRSPILTNHRSRKSFQSPVWRIKQPLIGAYGKSRGFPPHATAGNYRPEARKPAIRVPCAIRCFKALFLKRIYSCPFFFQLYRLCQPCSSPSGW